MNVSQAAARLSIVFLTILVVLVGSPDALAWVLEHLGDILMGAGVIVILGVLLWIDPARDL